MMRLIALALPLLLVSCAGGDEPVAVGHPADTSAADAAADLSIGSQGPEVGRIHAYLQRLGYLPDATVAARYPRSRPIVATAPLDPSVFDARTEDAVRALQQRSGLPATGIVDAATRELIAAPRCGVPDHLDVHADGDGVRRALDAADTREGTAAASPAQVRPQFVHWGRWDRKRFRWRVMDRLGNATCSLEQARTAAATALSRWALVTDVTFEEAPRGPVDIEFFTDPDFDWTPSMVAYADLPPVGLVRLNPAANLRCDGHGVDLTTILVHELGHTLGLGHSSKPGATMRPGITVGSDLTLDRDDAIAISLLYDGWTDVAAARDVATSPSAVWIITDTPVGSNYAIAARLNGNWQQDTVGSGVRIAIGPGGRPWVVNAAGEIWRRTAATVGSGTWRQIPGCATDVAGNASTVWILGCSATSGGYQVYRWDGGDGFVRVSTDDQRAERIAVGKDGVPWIITPAGGVFRRSADATGQGSWTSLGAPQPNPPFDIAADEDGNACATGRTLGSSERFTHVHHEQTELRNSAGEVLVPSLSEWIRMDAPARSCAITAQGLWLVRSLRLLEPD